MPKSKSDKSRILERRRKSDVKVRNPGAWRANTLESPVPGSSMGSPGGRVDNQYKAGTGIPTFEPETGSGIKRMIKDGCYLVRYVPAEPSPDVLFYEGTVRVMRVMPDGQRDPDKGDLRAGADLYGRVRHDADLSQKDPVEWGKRNPAEWNMDPDADGKAIPIFPRAHYRYYLEITKILEDVPVAGDVSVSFAVHEFRQDVEWPNPGSRWLCLRLMPASGPSKFKEYFAGNVLDQDSGQIVGTMTMCRISECLRRATVAIHRVKEVRSSPGDFGMENEPQAAWNKAFAEAGWSLDLEADSGPDLLDPVAPDGTWTIGELQQALYAIRIRRMVMPKVIEDAEKAAGKPLAKMKQMEIQEVLPLLSTHPDPLDQEWLYQLLCVRRIDGFDRGVMFDPYGSDSENLPREGAAVAAEWKFGDDASKLLQNSSSAEQDKQADEIKRKWGDAEDNQLQKVSAAYFRVGVHEIGHSMGLDHNFKDDGFMNTTDSIADDELSAQREAFISNLQVSQLASLPPGQKQLLQDAIKLGIPSASKITLPMLVTPTACDTSQTSAMPTGSVTTEPCVPFNRVLPFPDFIELQFQADDLNRLRFGPDVTVRPGTSFHDLGPLFGDSEPTPATGLSLEVAPLLDSIPIGAPARIKVKITNNTCEPQGVPTSLSLNTGVISGSVLDPVGNERTFWPLKQAEDSDPGGVLAPYETRTFTMTLLRGAQKALFAMAGEHRVKVTATWHRDGNPVSLASEAPVRVTTAVDDNHRAAALKVLSTPDALFSLAIIGDHLTEGNAAIEAAVNNPILRPHFAIVRAKLLLKGPSTVDPSAACDLIDPAVVMSFEEIESITELLFARYPQAGGDLGGAKVPATASCQPGTDLYQLKLQQAVSCLLSKILILRANGSIEPDRADRLTKRLEKLKAPAAPRITGI